LIEASEQNEEISCCCCCCFYARVNGLLKLFVW